jgi:hypothetical protein
VYCNFIFRFIVNPNVLLTGLTIDDGWCEKFTLKGSMLNIRYGLSSNTQSTKSETIEHPGPPIQDHSILAMLFIANEMKIEIYATLGLTQRGNG